MTEKRKALIHALLKGIETGDGESVSVVNQEKYIQHNPQTQEGGVGLAELFKQLAKTSPRVNIVRLFSDGDYVFGQTEYDFGSPRVGFEVFRFEGNQAVEHWDNIQPREGPNTSGHSMVDGAVQVSDLESTGSNREVVRAFVDELLIEGRLDMLDKYIDAGNYTEHHPRFGDDLSILNRDDNGISYDKRHRLLAEGDFVLAVCEGVRDEMHSAFFDLYRLDDGRIVEHWNTTEAIPTRTEWKNDNGKF